MENSPTGLKLSVLTALLTTAALLAALSGFLVRLLTLLVVLLTAALLLAALAALLVLLLIGHQVTPCWGCQGQRHASTKRSFRNITLNNGKLPLPAAVVRQIDACFVVRGQAFAYRYFPAEGKSIRLRFEDEPWRRLAPSG
jgi:hypothetical protein